MTKIRVEEGELFVSLFTKTPIKERCKVIRKRLENDERDNKEENHPECQGTADIYIVDNELQISRGNLPTELRSSHWKPSIPHCCEHIHGGLVARHHHYSTRGLSTEKLDEICGRRHLSGTHRKDREIATTHEDCRSHG